MPIRLVTEDRRRYLPLLLLADEQESMVERYLHRGELYVMEEPDPAAVCLVTDEGGVLEIKNLAVTPGRQRQGLGRAMVEFVAQRWAGRYRVLQVGTGDSPLTIPFYESCGFRYSHRIPDFFTKNYDHPIYEQGVLLTDMVYLRRSLEP